MKLEFVPVREKDGTKLVRHRRGNLRLYFIVGDGGRAPLSGGFTIGAAPVV